MNDEPSSKNFDPSDIDRARGLALLKETLQLLHAPGYTVAPDHNTDDADLEWYAEEGMLDHIQTSNFLVTGPSSDHPGFYESLVALRFEATRHQDGDTFMREDVGHPTFVPPSAGCELTFSIFPLDGDIRQRYSFAGVDTAKFSVYGKGRDARVALEVADGPYVDVTVQVPAERLFEIQRETERLANLRPNQQ